MPKFAKLVYSISVCYGISVQILTATAPLPDLTSPADLGRFTPTSPSVTTTAGPTGMTVTTQPGNDKYPGVTLAPTAPDATFDFSASGYLEADVTNTGSSPVIFDVRVDNKTTLGGLWMEDYAKIGPGESKPVRLYFSEPTNGFQLDRISLIQFLGNSPGSYVITKLVLGGAPGDFAPGENHTLVTPADGVIYSGGAPVQPAQLGGKGNVALLEKDGALTASFPAATDEKAEATFQLPDGYWDLGNFLQVRMTLQNTGADPVTPSVRIDSSYGPSDTFTASTPLAPGAKAELVIPFAAKAVWQAKMAAISAGSREGSRVTAFGAHRTKDFAISAGAGGKDRSLRITLDLSALTCSDKYCGVWVI